MQIILTWDLFISLFFAIIVAYSFIVGKTQTVKIVLCTYLALLFADGIGNLVEFHLRGVSPIIDLFLKYIGEDVFVIGKVVLFVFATVFLTIRGGFNIQMTDDRGFANLIVTFLFAVMCAGLIVSTILIFVSGGSLLEPSAVASTFLADVRKDSLLAQLIVNHYNWWFSIPALSFMVYSLIAPESD